MGCLPKSSMIRKYHNHKLQTDPWHHEEEPHNTHETLWIQTKQSNQLYLPDQDDCKTRMDIKSRITKHRTITKSHNESINQQRINTNRTTALERTAATRGLNVFYWYQIFALDSTVVEALNVLSWHGGFLTIAMYHHVEIILSN